MKPDDLLADLTPPQREAVTHRDGPLLVLAGAGSGKTRVITRRAAWLAMTATKPRHVLAITFTNKAADEMRARIRELGIGQQMLVCTFHALCARLLRMYAGRIGLEAGFSIFDESDRKRLVRLALERCGLSEANWSPGRVQSAISRAKNAMKTPEEFAAQAGDFAERTIARVYQAYEQLLAEQHALDFDDLLARTARALQDDAALRDELEDRFRYILIDEYQDTNRAQYLIARALSRNRQNICATGDPDQSIYAWRGADIHNILDFEQDYPHAKVVRLEQNYRSTKRILAAAAALVAVNTRRKPKQLWTHNAEGSRVRVIECADADDEAHQIVETIGRLQQQGYSLGDMAVFYRINALTRVLEQALTRAGLPYQIARGVEFYSRKEIKDVLAYLRVVINPADEVSLLRIINTPARGIGKGTIDRLRSHARQTGRSLLEIVQHVEDVPGLGRTAKQVRAFADLIGSLAPVARSKAREGLEHVLAATGLGELLRQEAEAGSEAAENVAELVTAAAEYDERNPDGTLAQWLDQVSLVSDVDTLDESAGAVNLMTLHAAKGLEFPVVFIMGLEDGLLPHHRYRDDGEQLEEERRLCFVGMTRAKEHLTLTWARSRSFRGISHRSVRSPFLEELPEDQLEQVRSPAAQEIHDHAERRRSQGSEVWQVGQLVRHASFGLGRLVWIQRGVGLTRAQVRFNTCGDKTLILEYAGLEPVRSDAGGPS